MNFLMKPDALAPNPYTREGERALLDLIALDDPIGQTLNAAQHLYDNGPEGGPVAVLGPTHLLSTLRRWEEGEVSSNELRAWAQLLTQHTGALVHRPYFAFEIGHVRGISEVIGKLADQGTWPYNGTLIRQLKARAEMTDADAEAHARRYL